MTKTPSKTIDYRRRDLLSASLKTVAWSVLAGNAALDSVRSALAATDPAQSVDSTDFFRVSAFLTGKSDLNKVTAEKTWAALTEIDPGFAKRFAALQTSLQSDHLTDMQGFDTSATAQDTGLRATAVEIVSAWYLGHVGSGAKAKLLAYHDALMYRPTAGITAVPTYQPGGFGYWTTTPPAA